MSERGRMILFVIGMLVLFTTVSLLVSATTAFDYTRDHASSRTNPWGTKAWRELIGRCGVETRDWLAPLTTLSDEVEFLVLLDPTEVIEDDERTALRDWVRGGGRLLLAPFAKRADTSIDGRWARAAMDQVMRQFGVTLASTTRWRRLRRPPTSARSTSPAPGGWALWRTRPRPIRQSQRLPRCC